MNAAPPLHCAALLFDLDGVLVDSAECVERTWRLWATRHGLDPARAIEVAHGRRTIDGVYQVPGARELLQSLPPNAWAIVTSGVRSVATLRLRHTELPNPPVLVCADDIQRGKPDPEGYLVAAQALGREPADCVVVEDAPAGLEAARAAGMRAIAIVGTFPATSLVIADAVAPRLDALRVTSLATGSPLEIQVVIH
jgi:sugar-phosphatase